MAAADADAGFLKYIQPQRRQAWRTLPSILARTSRAPHRMQKFSEGAPRVVRGVVI
jgi:hypothetical protein